MPEMKVLVTGAAGFIGSRLVERLKLGTDYELVAMVRRFTGAGLARLARMPVRFVLADLLDPASLARAAEGCDVIVHCAYGSSGDQNLRRQVSVLGTENLLKAALQAGVGKVIYLSSAIVHGRSPREPLVDEETGFAGGGYAYDRAKVEAEQLAWHYHRQHGLPLVVFRPTLVYGPYDRRWAERTVGEIRNGAVLVNGGSGAANLLYIDNLVDAILLSLEKNAGDGEAFILTDDEAITWRQFYERLAQMIHNHPPLLSLSMAEIAAMRKAGRPGRLESWVVAPLQLGPQVVRQSLQSPEIRGKIREIPWMRTVIGLVPEQVRSRMGTASGRQEMLNGKTAERSRPARLPSQEMAELYAAQARYSTQKVKTVLGYRQRISFDEAIELTRAWLAYQRLIP